MLPHLNPNPSHLEEIAAGIEMKTEIEIRIGMKVPNGLAENLFPLQVLVTTMVSRIKMKLKEIAPVMSLRWHMIHFVPKLLLTIAAVPPMATK